MNSVVDWFGAGFITLDPLLQDLHQYGGTLSGVVDLEYGSGLAGFIGRKLAPKLGLPLLSGKVDFEVNISHANGVLMWDRQFCKSHKMSSIFVPHGQYPDGYWSESTGKLSLELGIEVREGGWYWKQRKVKFMDVQLPLWFFPASQAYKRITNGMYEFSVTFTLPLLGKLVSYSGVLTPKTTPVIHSRLI
jgi:hypothetical protein